MSGEKKKTPNRSEVYIFIFILTTEQIKTKMYWKIIYIWYFQENRVSTLLLNEIRTSTCELERRMLRMWYINSIHVGKSSRRHDPLEVSGTFSNLFLIYKICSPLYLLIGLQRNTLYSKTNQPETAFLRQYICLEKWPTVLLRSIISTETGKWWWIIDIKGNRPSSWS